MTAEPDEDLTEGELEELRRLADEGGDVGAIGRAWLSIEEDGA